MLDLPTHVTVVVAGPQEPPGLEHHVDIRRVPTQDATLLRRFVSATGATALVADVPTVQGLQSALVTGVADLPIWAQALFEGLRRDTQSRGPAGTHQKDAARAYLRELLDLHLDHLAIVGGGASQDLTSFFTALGLRIHDLPCPERT